MSLEEYLVPVQDHANICFDCANACGGCSWSELDAETGLPRFAPVPGWTCHDDYAEKAIEKWRGPQKEA